jgi:tetratricopeptide (TPR) repeat protein
MFLSLAGRERRLAVLLREHDNFRAALDYALAAGDPVGPRLARALGGFWLAHGFFHEGQDWLERALAAGPADQWLRADLLRLIGTVLCAAGDFEQARITLGQAREAAEAAGATSVQARIRVLQAEIHVAQGGTLAEALAACEAAMPLLEAGDLEGMADAWLLVGKLRLWRGDDPVRTDQALERAADCARRSANRRAEQESANRLAYNLFVLPIPADEAVSRAESLLQAASGDSWAEALILHPLSWLYTYAGRFADARAALARSQSVFAGAGARFDWAIHSVQAGRIELIAGDPAAAERDMTAGFDALRALANADGAQPPPRSWLRLFTRRGGSTRRCG